MQYTLGDSFVDRAAAAAIAASQVPTVATIPFQRAAAAAIEKANEVTGTAQYQTATSGVMANQIVPNGAGFAVTPQSAQAYRRLSLVVRSKKVGTHEMWPNGKRFYPDQAINALVTDPVLMRRTMYDYSWVEMTGHATCTFCHWVNYTDHLLTFNYQDPARYFASLESEYDYKAFLSLLKLRRSAGVESAFPGTYDVLAKNFVGVLSAYIPQVAVKAGFTMGLPKYIPIGLPIMGKQPFNPFTDASYLGDIRGVWVKSMFSASPLMLTQKSAIDPEKISADIIGKLRYAPYIDYAVNHAAFVDQVFRFRERVLAFALHETGKMLDWTQLEDLDTLVTLSNYIAQQGMAPYNEIKKDEFVDIYDHDKILTPEQKKVNFDNADIVRVMYGNGKYDDADVQRLLVLQYEAAILIFLVNQPKYFGRIIQLGDHANVLRENNIPAFQSDPFRNPFLVFDLAASKAAGKPIYKNIAAAQAQIPAERAAVSTEFIPLAALEKAPDAWAQYVRTSQGGGVYASKAVAEKSSAPWVLAALAAAGGLYLMNR